MKNKKWESIVLSFAGIIQSAKLVQALARHGHVDETAFAHSVQSILTLQSQSPEEALGSIKGVELGLKEIQTLFAKKAHKNNAEIIRYMVSLLYLERKLHKSPELRKTLSRRIKQAQSQATHFSTTDPHVIQTLASAFLQTLGQFRYRIQIRGNVTYLKQAATLAAIRTCLLSGIRATVLWRQMGGNKWQLVFFRKKMIEISKHLLTR